MPLQLPPELERRIVHLAAEMHREPQAVLTELLGAALDEDSAFPHDDRDQGEGSDDEEAGTQAPLPHDWNDYLRYRFEQGRAAMARGDHSETPPAELMARVRARVEKNP
jgi:predicted transcriptional regulator